jgi:transcriptional/translational regulatory protein YebC/TACO1
MIMTVTDNPNRTSSELKAILTRAGGSMGGPGSAKYMFEFDKTKQEYQVVLPLAVEESTREKIELLKEALSGVEGVEGVYSGISDNSLDANEASDGAE